jgi:hypothetical protein
MATADQAPVTNGTSAVASDAAPESPVVERSKMTRSEQDAADKAAFLAGVDGEADAEPAKPAPKKKPAPIEDDADSSEVDALEDVVDEEEDDLDLEDDEDEDADKTDDEEDDDDKSAASNKSDDPELAKRLAQVRKQEKRVRAQADERERAFVAERQAFVAEWKPKFAELEKFNELKSRKSDIGGLLKTLGYTDDEFGETAQILWGLSKEGAADPKYRDHSKRLMENRSLREEVAAARQEAAEAKELQSRRDAETAADRQIDVYRQRVVKTLGDQTPYAKKQMELAPKRTQLALDKIALELAKKAGTGALVDPKLVSRAYEKKLRATVERAKLLAGDEPVAAPAKGAKPVAAKVKSTAITVVDRTKDAAPAPAKTNGSLLPSRSEMIERLDKLNRGEIDPDVD